MDLTELAQNLNIHHGHVSAHQKPLVTAEEAIHNQEDRMATSVMAFSCFLSQASTHSLGS